MASDEFLERIDGHLARGNELMKEVREEIEMTRISYDHQLHVTPHAIVRNAESMDALREEVREGFRSMDALREEVREGFRGLREEMNEMRQDIREMRESIGALTEAVLKLLDRIDNGPQPAGA